MKRATSILTIAGAVILAAVTLQPQPFSVATSDDQPRKVNERPAVSSEQIDRWLEVAEEVDPANAQRLRAMCHHDPEEFHRVMRQSGRSIVSLAELRTSDPELYDLKVAELRIEAQVEETSAALLQAMQQGDEKEIQAVEQELRQVVLMQVLHSIRAQGDYLNRLKQHVQHLEQQLQRDAENWQLTTEQRVQDIIDRSRSQAVAAKP